MAEITAALVKELREKTGAGMMDCKNALNENDGDLEAAVDWLRTQGLAAAAKKSGRAASEGLVGIATDGNKGAVVEVNAETDFVARNDDFQGFVENVTTIALGGDGSIDGLKDAAYTGGKGTVSATLTNMIATIGENMDLRRSAALEVGNGVVCSYMHNALKPGLGKIGVLVALESEGDTAQLEALGKQLAMHEIKRWFYGENLLKLQLLKQQSKLLFSHSYRCRDHFDKNLRFKYLKSKKSCGVVHFVIVVGMEFLFTL